MSELALSGEIDQEEANIANVPKQLRDHAFKPGQSGNPKGKPKGVKNKLSECFINDLYDSWKRRGMQALEQMAQDKPGEYVRAIASIMPKDVMVTLDQQGAGYVINAKPMDAEEWAKAHNVKIEHSQDAPE